MCTTRFQCHNKIARTMQCLAYYFIGVMVIINIASVGCHETDMQKELLLTFQEKQAFDKFKSKVWSNVSHAHGFLKTDIFLLRWIRSKDLNVGRAVRDLNDCLEWRRVNKIDTIHKEDWSDMNVDYPYNMDVIDLQGRPVVVASIGGNWNIRRGIMQGRMPRITRYLWKMVEELFDRLYVINQNHPNVTQFSVLTSLDGFNMIQQACPLCLATYVQLFANYNRFYPNFAHALIAINTPEAFTVIVNLLKPMIDKSTRDALQFFGYDKRQWKPVLDREINENQLTIDFGGTKQDDDR